MVTLVCDLRGRQSLAPPPSVATTSYRGRLDVLGEGEKVTPAKIQLEAVTTRCGALHVCECVCVEWKYVSSSVFHVRPLPACYQTAGSHHLLQHQQRVCVWECVIALSVEAPSASRSFSV